MAAKPTTPARKLFKVLQSSPSKHGRQYHTLGGAYEAALVELEKRDKDRPPPPVLAPLTRELPLSRIDRPPDTWHLLLPHESVSPAFIQEANALPGGSSLLDFKPPNKKAKPAPRTLHVGADITGIPPGNLRPPVNMDAVLAFQDILSPEMMFNGRFHGASSDPLLEPPVTAGVSHRSLAMHDAPGLAFERIGVKPLDYITNDVTFSEKKDRTEFRAPMLGVDPHILSQPVSFDPFAGISNQALGLANLGFDIISKDRTLAEPKINSTAGEKSAAIRVSRRSKRGRKVLGPYWNHDSGSKEIDALLSQGGVWRKDLNNPEIGYFRVK